MCGVFKIMDLSFVILTSNKGCTRGSPPIVKAHVSSLLSWEQILLKYNNFFDISTIYILRGCFLRSWICTWLFKHPMRDVKRGLHQW